MTTVAKVLVIITGMFLLLSILIWIQIDPKVFSDDAPGAEIPPYPHQDKSPLYETPLVVPFTPTPYLTLPYDVHYRGDIPTAIDCTGAPQQYVAAHKWIGDGGREFVCDENGGYKHYIFYSDAIIH